MKLATILILGFYLGFTTAYFNVGWDEGIHYGIFLNIIPIGLACIHGAIK